MNYRHHSGPSWFFTKVLALLQDPTQGPTWPSTFHRNEVVDAFVCSFEYTLAESHSFE